LLYIYFHRATPKLKGNFHASPQMQKISREQLVFVDMTVPKKPKGQLRELLKRCGIRRVPAAAITDRYGNPLYVGASTTKPKTLRSQIKRAELTAAKMAAKLSEWHEKAREHCRRRRYSQAAKTLADVQEKGLVGLPVLEKIDTLYGKINRYIEKRLSTILQADGTAATKKEKLRVLKAKTYRDLPVYKKITAAYKEVS
jgi:hypothetical protein